MLVESIFSHMAAGLGLGVLSLFNLIIKVLIFHLLFRLLGFTGGIIVLLILGGFLLYSFYRRRSRRR